MQIRSFHESDGRCFAKTAGGCTVFGKQVDSYI